MSPTTFTGAGVSDAKTGHHSKYPGRVVGGDSPLSARCPGAIVAEREWPVGVRVQVLQGAVSPDRGHIPTRRRWTMTGRAGPLAGHLCRCWRD